MVQWQPARHAHRLFQLRRRIDLDDVRHDGLVGEHHACRVSGGAGGVLQEGHMVRRIDVPLHLSGHPAGSERVRQRVDRDDARAFLARQLREESAHCWRALLVGEHHVGLGVGEDRAQVTFVARFGWVVERHRDLAGVHGTHESEDVLGAVARQDGHAVPRCADLLQARRHRLDACVHFRARERAQRPVWVRGVVPRADVDGVCRTGLCGCPVEHLGEGRDGEVRREFDLAGFVNKPLNQCLEIHGHSLLSGPRI